MTKRRAREQERLFWDLVFRAVSGLVCLSIGFLGCSVFIDAVRLTGRWLG